MVDSERRWLADHFEPHYDTERYPFYDPRWLAGNQELASRLRNLGLLDVYGGD